MQVNFGSSNYELFSQQNKASALQGEDKEKLAQKFKKISQELGGAKGMSAAYFMNFQMQTINFSDGNFKYQNFAFQLSFGGDFNNNFDDPISKVKNLLKGVDLSQIGYQGKPISDLSADEAKKLVSEDGFFGVAKTSQRIADFVLSGAGSDLEKLKAGKEGILRGFKQAEQMWGGKLPDIAYETIEKSTKQIDEQISKLGGNAIDVKA